MGTTNLVFWVILSATWFMSIFQVSGSESTKTGVAPVYATALTVAIIVNVGRITSSPGPRSIVAMAKCSAEVPLVQATAYLVSHSSANALSKAVMKRPAEEIQLVSRHSFTYFFSLPLRVGSQTGIDLLCLPFKLRFWSSTETFGK